LLLKSFELAGCGAKPGKFQRRASDKQCTALHFQFNSSSRVKLLSAGKIASWREDFGFDAAGSGCYASLIAGSKMEYTTSSFQCLVFDNFEVDLRSGELRKNGRRVRIQSLPFQLLRVLMERPNAVVTRDEVLRRLWSEDTFVDFDHSIGTAVNKLREALGDSARKPRYVETLPRRGYRFIGKIEHARSEGPFRAAGPRSEPSHPVMLAVLPFQNFSGDPAQDYFTDGLTEEMITQLGKLNGNQLGVIARTTSMAYKHTSKDVGQIGRELAVDYVMESSVRREGDQVRITVQLIHVKNQAHVWANNYDREVRDSIAVQEEVARAVAQQIDVSLSRTEAGKGTLNPAANEAYLRGRFFLNQFTEDGYTQATSYFNCAIEADPKFAPPYAGLSEAYTFLVITNNISPHEGWPKVRGAAQKAVEMDSDLSEGRLNLAHFRMHMWDWKGAEADFERAIALNPNSDKAHRWHAAYLSSVGRHQEAIEEVTVSRGLDPLSSIANIEIARELYYARQYEGAIEEAHKAELLDPHYARVHFWLGRAYAQIGKHSEALARAERAGPPGSVLQLTEMAYASARAGNISKCRALLGTLQERATRGYVPAYDFAVIHIALRENEAALEYMQKAYDEHAWALIVLAVEPRLDPLRSAPSFQRLLGKVGLHRL
jgi:TolB-like protein